MDEDREEKLIPKFLFLRRISEEDLGRGHEVQVIQLLVSLVVTDRIRLNHVFAIDFSVAGVLVGRNMGFGAK